MDVREIKKEIPVFIGLIVVVFLFFAAWDGR